MQKLVKTASMTLALAATSVALLAGSAFADEPKPSEKPACCQPKNGETPACCKGEKPNEKPKCCHGKHEGKH